MVESVSLRYRNNGRSALVKDRWDYWVFQVRVNTRLEGRKTKDEKQLSGSINVDRITPASKFRLFLSGRWEKEIFESDDYSYTAQTDNGDFRSMYVVSINDHWSIGGWLSAKTSTYSNIDVSLSPQPAIEYDFFPYSESTRRQLRILYRTGYNYVRYRETTIYDKIKENLFNHALSVTLELTEQWGNARFTMEGSHYLHDMSKKRFTVWGSLSFRIFKGFNFDVNGNYSATHDQLSLVMGETSTEDILLQKKELASDYRYRFSIGFSYRFGSLFSNVVNPRFGDHGFSQRRY